MPAEKLAIDQAEVGLAQCETWRQTFIKFVNYSPRLVYWPRDFTVAHATNGGLGPMAENISVNAPPDSLLKNELHNLVERAQAGDPGALPGIRQILDDHPEIWRHVGDLSHLVEGALIAVLSANDPVAAEAMRRTIREMKAELVGDDPRRLVKMLVDEIVVAWLGLKLLDMLSAGKQSDWVAREAHLRTRIGAQVLPDDHQDADDHTGAFADRPCPACSAHFFKRQAKKA